MSDQRESSDVIDRIAAIRARNNGTWMDLLRLAVEADPQRAKVLLGRIQEHDTAITRLLRELAESL